MPEFNEYLYGTIDQYRQNNQASRCVIPQQDIDCPFLWLTVDGRVFDERKHAWREWLAHTKRRKLCVGNKIYRKEPVARLLLWLYDYENYFTDACALHWDDNALNDTLSNLRWGTRTENTEDRIRNGKQLSSQELSERTKTGHLLAGYTSDKHSEMMKRVVEKNKMYGENLPQTSYSEAAIAAAYTEARKANRGFARIAKKYGLPTVILHKVLTKDIWRRVSDAIDLEFGFAPYVAGNFVFTEEDVRNIYTRLKKKESCTKLAKEYGRSIGTISAIKNKRTWKTVTDKIDIELDLKSKGDSN